MQFTNACLIHIHVHIGTRLSLSTDHLAGPQIPARSGSAAEISMHRCQIELCEVRPEMTRETICVDHRGCEFRSVLRGMPLFAADSLMRLYFFSFVVSSPPIHMRMTHIQEGVRSLMLPSREEAQTKKQTGEEGCLKRGVDKRK